MSKVTFGMIDHSNESSTTGIYIPQITAANYDAVVDDSSTGVVGRLRIAIAILSTMNETTRTVTAEQFKTPPTLPSDVYAQRERKLLVRYVDLVNNKKAILTIPSPDNSTLAQTGTDEVDFVNNVVAAAFVVSFEADAVSQDGNAVAVVGMSIVGRNI